MRGSWSIKSVLPTVAPELDYGDLEVQGEPVAQQKYMDLLNQEISEEDLKKGRNTLLKYCEQDTLVMVKLAQLLD